MKAVGNYIVITEIKEQHKTESGLLLTSQDAEKFRYKKGKVIEPGNECKVIKKKDIIYYDKAAGHSLMLNDEICTIIREFDVVVVV